MTAPTQSVQNPDTLKGGHGPAEVWITHHETDWGRHLEGVNHHPWDDKYLQAAPPITKYASNERYVRGDLSASPTQPVQEPVAWAETYDGGHHYNTVSLTKTRHHTVPLYAHPATPAPVDAGLRAHIKQMQSYVQEYLEPGPYVSKHGKIETFNEPHKHQIEGYAIFMREQMRAAVLHDLIHMLDGPEERDALRAQSAPQSDEAATLQSRLEESEPDEAWKDGFNAGFGEAKLADDGTEQRLRAELAEARIKIERREKRIDSLKLRAEAAEAEVERLRVALKPFAEAEQYCDPEFGNDYAPRWAEFFTLGDFRRALAAHQARRAGE